MNQAAADTLLARVSHRRAWRTLLNASGSAALGLATLYAVALVVARWQVGTTWLERPLVPCLLALAALLFGLQRAGFGDRAAAARAVDAHAGGDDLFLTHVALTAHRPQAALLPIVDAQIDARARAVDARAVAGPSPKQAIRGWLGGLAMAGLAFAFAPLGKPGPAPLPPRPRLTAKAEARIEALRKREVQAPQSPPVEAARLELAKVMAKLQPERKQELRAELRQVEHKLSDLWQQAKRNNAGERGDSSSQLGSGDRSKREQWQNELKAGKVDALKQQLQEVNKEAKTAAEKGDVEAAARARAATRELKAFARAHGAKDLDAAMAEMLEALGSQDLSSEELAKLGERADLELDALRQAGADLDKLAQALRTEQLAEALSALDRPMPEFDPDAALEEYEKAMGDLLDQTLDDLPECEDCDGGG